MSDMIQIKGLNKYFGDLHVLKDVNLNVKAGEKLVVIGPSGSGKSTLIRCVDFLEEPRLASSSSTARRLPRRITWRWPASIPRWCFSSSICIPT